MNVVRCEKGHYFDGDLYAGCPHCGKERMPVPAAESRPEKEKPKRFGFGKKHGKKAVPAEADSPREVSFVCEPTQMLSEKEVEALMRRAPGAREKGNVAVRFDKVINGETDPGTQKKVPAVPAPESAGEAEAVAKAEKDVQTDFPAQGIRAEKTEGAVKNAPMSTPALPADLPERKAPARMPAQETCSAEADGRTLGFFSSSEDTVSPCVGWLVGISGDYRGVSFELKAGGNTVGRTAENAVVLAKDNRVSRAVHARIVYEPRTRKFFIEPGQSSGLTYVNGEIILHQTALTGIETIEMGGGYYKLVPFCGAQFSWEDTPALHPICRDAIILGGVQS